MSCIYADMGEYQRVMKSLTLPLVDRPACVDSLRTTRLGPYFRLHPTFLCAGGEKGKDACKVMKRLSKFLKKKKKKR